MYTLDNILLLNSIIFSLVGLGLAILPLIDKTRTTIPRIKYHNIISANKINEDIFNKFTKSNFNKFKKIESLGIDTLKISKLLYTNSSIISTTIADTIPENKLVKKEYRLVLDLLFIKISYI